MHLILFFLFAGFCLAGAINLLLQTHPINSALSLIVVMTSLAVLYLLLGAEFLAIGRRDGAVHLRGHAAQCRP
jgi:NADH-quinone oxidoreductase subunit J